MLANLLEVAKRRKDSSESHLEKSPQTVKFASPILLGGPPNGPNT